MKTEEYETEHLTRLGLINDNELNSVSLKKKIQTVIRTLDKQKLSSVLITPNQPPYTTKIILYN